MSVVETPRLLLRPPEAADVPEMLTIHQHPDVMRYVGGTGGDIGVAWRAVAMMVGHWQMRGYGPWVLVSKADGSIMGRAGLWNVDGGPGLELGWLVRRDAWGRGVATEAARAALAWAWEHLAHDHVVSLIQTANVPSIRVAEKIGQRLEKRELVRGREVCTYGIHRDS
ncbi:MAG: GNAT family N-acetyltransferase [Vicinamibacterales bacterium]